MSYIGKYFSPRMFYFRAVSDEAHEKRSSALATNRLRETWSVSCAIGMT